MSNFGMRELVSDWAIGDFVSVDQDPTPLRVTAVLWRHTGVQYEVSWFVDAQSRTAWVEEYRMRQAEDIAIPAGFRHG